MFDCSDIRKELSSNMQKLVDGLGTKRLVNELSTASK